MKQRRSDLGKGGILKRRRNVITKIRLYIIEVYIYELNLNPLRRGILVPGAGILQVVSNKTQALILGLDINRAFDVWISIFIALVTSGNLTCVEIYFQSKTRLTLICMVRIKNTSSYKMFLFQRDSKT